VSRRTFTGTAKPPAATSDIMCYARCPVKPGPRSLVSDVVRLKATSLLLTMCLTQSDPASSVNDHREVSDD